MIRYQITNGRYAEDPLAWMRSLRRDVDFIQIRERDLPVRELVRVTREVISEFHAKVLVNDRIDVAIASGAAGVHLRSGSIEAARVKVLRSMIVTVACHDFSELPDFEGADFVLVAPVFAPRSKESDRPPLGVAGLAEFVRRSPVPVLALGGVTPENGGACIEAGAVGVAGITFLKMGTDAI